MSDTDTEERKGIMNREQMILWILEIIAFMAGLYAVQIPLRKKGFPALKAIIFVLKILLIPAAALLFVAIVNSLTYRHSDMFAAAYIALIADVGADGVCDSVAPAEEGGTCRGKL